MAVPEANDLAEAFQQGVTFPTPGAGLPATRLVPGDTYEQLLSANFLFHTSAAAGNRVVRMILNDAGGNALLAQPAFAVQGPNFTGQYTIDGNGGTSYGPVGINYVIGIPAILLQPGMAFAIFADNMDAADSFSALTALLFRVPTNRPAVPTLSLVPTPMLA